uniref:Uncharacterized protein n=1 Tax=Arundo donax TaxID=35708 RepID=A0A0A9FJM9_ARUDO
MHLILCLCCFRFPSIVCRHCFFNCCVILTFCFSVSFLFVV